MEVVLRGVPKRALKSAPFESRGRKFLAPRVLRKGAIEDEVLVLKLCCGVSQKKTQQTAPNCLAPRVLRKGAIEGGVLVLKFCCRVSPKKTHKLPQIVSHPRC